MNLGQGWHLLLGDYEGRSLSDPLDCCAYGLETDAGLVMFDAGAGRDPVRTEAAFESAGLAAGPSFVLLTHGHADHSGGASTIRERFDARLYAGGMTAGWLETGDEEATSLAAARRAGIYPTDYRPRPCPVDRRFSGGDAVRIGEAVIRVIATPGHSADHISYLVEARGRKVLVAGDALFAGGKVVLQDTWDCSVVETCATIRVLAGLHFDWLLPGHGPPLLGDGRKAAEQAMERVSRFLPPLNLL